MTRIVAVALTLGLLGGCFGPDPNVTEEGEGLPVLTLDFPSEVETDSVATAVLTIENPGPEDMESLVVAFSRLGDPELPLPLVEVSAPDEDGPVRSIDPEPRAVGQGGVVFTFEGIAEGEETTITFELAIPSEEGKVGNSIQVYDGADPDRARGVRLEASVTR